MEEPLYKAVNTIHAKLDEIVGLYANVKDDVEATVLVNGDISEETATVLLRFQQDLNNLSNYMSDRITESGMDLIYDRLITPKFWETGEINQIIRDLSSMAEFLFEDYEDYYENGSSYDQSDDLYRAECRIEELETDLYNAETDRDEYERELKDAEEKIRDLESRIEDLEYELDELRGGGV